MCLHFIVFVYLYNHNIARQRIALLREKQSGCERSPTETRIMVHPPPSHLAQLQTNDQIMKNTDESPNKDKTSTILCFSYFVSGDFQSKSKWQMYFAPKVSEHPFYNAYKSDL